MSDAASPSVMSSVQQAPIQQWLAVECGGQGLLLPLRQTSEIFTPSAIKPVPYTRSWMLGVAHLRGGLCTVVDLADFLGLRPREGQGAGSQRWVALHADLACNAALLVDRVIGLRGEAQLKATSAQDVSGRPRFAGPVMQDEPGRLWQVLELDALASHPDFVHISA